MGNEELLSYLPDNPDMKSINRELLLSILFYGNRAKYLSLYEEYKELQIQLTMIGNKKFIDKVTEEMLQHLHNFKPINMLVNKIMSYIIYFIFFIGMKLE